MSARATTETTTLALRLPPLLLVALLVHVAVLPQLRVAGVAADVLLLVGIAAGLVAGPDRGAAVGFVAGLLADLFLQTPFGLSALASCLAGWTAGSFSISVLSATRWMQLAVVALTSAGGVLAFSGVGALLGEGHLLSGRLGVVALVVGLLNALLAPLFLRAARWAMPEVPAFA